MLTYTDTDNSRFYSLTSVNVEVGKAVISHYLRIMHSKSNCNSFTNWRINFLKDNVEFSNSIYKNDNTYVLIGTALTDILYNEGILTYEIVNKSREIKDKKLLNISKSDLIKVVFLKLPMIILPKKYCGNKLKGYLMNDINYADSIFINASKCILL